MKRNPPPRAGYFALTVMLLALLGSGSVAWAQALDLLQLRDQLVFHDLTQKLTATPVDRMEFLFGTSYHRKGKQVWLKPDSAVRIYTTGKSSLRVCLQVSNEAAFPKVYFKALMGDRELAYLPLEPGRWLEFRIPGDLLEPGENHLYFSFFSLAPRVQRRQLRFRFLAMSIDEVSSAGPSSAVEGFVPRDGHPAPHGRKTGDSGPLGSPISLLPGVTVQTWLPAFLLSWKIQMSGPPEPGQGLIHLRLHSADFTLLWKRDVQWSVLRKTKMELPALGEPAWLSVISGASSPITLRQFNLEGPVSLVPRITPLVKKIRPNILIYCVDTLRADALAAYGSSDAPTPNFDRFAKESLVFASARALTPWTRPSVASLLTGRQPLEHKAVEGSKGLSPDVPTLAQILAILGYRSEAVITNGNIHANFGFSKGYDDWKYYPEDNDRPGLHERAERVTNDLLRRLERLTGRRPFHLYVHVTDPHAPYDPPRQVVAVQLADPHAKAVLPRELQAFATAGIAEFPPDKLHRARQMYRAEVAYVDAQFGRLMEKLRLLGLLEDTLVIVTADHGEQFLEHGGLQHGFSFYHELLHVPLMLRLPGSQPAPRVSTSAVTHLDLLPTLLDIVGADAQPSLPGRNLAEVIDGKTRPALAIHFFNRGRFLKEGVFDGRYLMVVNHNRHGWKSKKALPLFELFDTVADPGNHQNIARTRSAMLSLLRQQLHRFKASLTRQATREGADVALDPELQETLEGLGYVN